MLLQQVTDALGVSIILADPTNLISAFLDLEDRETCQWTECLDGQESPAALCERTSRYPSGRRSPETISARG